MLGRLDLRPFTKAKTGCELLQIIGLLQSEPPRVCRSLSYVSPAGSVKYLSHIFQGVLIKSPFMPRALGSRFHLLATDSYSYTASIPILGLKYIGAGR